MTIKQKQCLLYYLGYYKGNIDGDWGAQSQKATLEFQKAYGLTTDGVFGDATAEKAKAAVAGTVSPVPVVTTDKGWEDIKYFRKAEFKCKCGKCGGFPAEPQMKLIQVADRVRTNFGAAATVSSGVRCPTHNKNVGGVSNSRHLQGKAMDFCIAGKTAKEVLAYVKKQPEIRYTYAIDSKYVHMDID